MFVVIYFIEFLHSVPQLHNSQQVMFNFRQGQIVGLAQFKGTPWDETFSMLSILKI